MSHSRTRFAGVISGEGRTCRAACLKLSKPFTDTSVSGQKITCSPLPSLFARKVLDPPQFEVVWESLRVGSGWKVGWLFSTVAGRWVCPLLQPAPASIPPAAARPGACHSVPQHATLCHRMPLCATACHYVLKNATLCHRMPPYAIECH